MAEDIGDLLQTGSAQSHLRRGRSSQGMGTQGAATQAATDERLLDGIAHNFGGDRDVMRRAVAYEHRATGAQLSRVAEVRHDGPSGQYRQRQDVGPPGLPGANPNRAVLPIQIVELQANDFLRAQPQVEETARHRVPALAAGATSIKGLQEAGNFVR